MYGSTTTKCIITDSRSSRNGYRNPFHSFWFRGWWILWVVCAQVDRLEAQIFSQSTTVASNNSSGDGYSARRHVRITGYPAGMQVKANGYSFNSTGSAFSTGVWTSLTAPPPIVLVAPSSPFIWAGHTTTTPQVANSPSKSVTIEYRLSGAAPTQTFTYEIPTATCSLTFGGTTAFFVKNFADLELAWNSTDGNWTVTDPIVTPPVINNLAKFYGKDISIPYYVEGTASTVTIGIGGQTLTFPVDHSLGGTGGLAMLNLPVPNGWDGTATINGQVIAIAPRIAYTGIPTMANYANPYLAPTDLPLGMTRGILPLPAGMTESYWFGLPAGVNSTTRLPMPAGIASISSTQVIGGELPVSSTTTGGVRSWTTASSGSSPSTVTTVTGGTREGTTVPTGEVASDAVLDSGMGAPATEVNVGTGLAAYGTKWDSLKLAIDNKFGDFQPLATGSIPKATIFSMTLNLGMFGNRAVELDLTGEPFATARVLALAFVTYFAAMWFINFIKI